MAVLGRSAEEVGPAAGMSVWEPSWGVLMGWTPVEEEEGEDSAEGGVGLQCGLHGNLDWLSGASWRWHGVSELTQVVARGLGFSTPRTDQSLSVGSSNKGLGHSQLRQSVSMADSWGLSPEGTSSSWENASFIPDGKLTWVSHHGVRHNHHISPNNKGSVGLSTWAPGYLLLTFVRKSFCGILFNIIQESVPRCLII